MSDTSGVVWDGGQSLAHQWVVLYFNVFWEVSGGNVKFTLSPRYTPDGNIQYPYKQKNGTFYPEVRQAVLTVTDPQGTEHTEGKQWVSPGRPGAEWEQDRYLDSHLPYDEPVIELPARSGTYTVQVTHKAPDYLGSLSTEEVEVKITAVPVRVRVGSETIEAMDVRVKTGGAVVSVKDIKTEAER